MKAIVAFVLIGLSGCTALGLPTAQTFNQKLAVGYGTVTTLLQTDTTLLTAGTISVNDAKNVETQIDTAKAGLDIARQTYATDQTTAGNKLASVLTALTAINTYLQTKQVSK